LSSRSSRNLKGSGKGYTEGEAERRLTVEVSNLTITKRKWAGSQKQQARKRKALLPLKDAVS
jgi:hypothetical protein